MSYVYINKIINVYKTYLFLQIPSISELQRISSKIEKLWVEGNPLCENMEPMTYIKQISLKFPRLTELVSLKPLSQYNFTFI